MSITVLLNHGGGSAGPDVGERVAAALAAAGLDAAIRVADGDALVAAAQEAVDTGAPMVVAGGGDGTLSSIAGVLAGSRTALGILPLGTLNHLARDLGLPSDLDEAARVIAEGHQQRIDVADLNGQVFVNNSAIGLYPLMVMDRESQQHRLGRSKRLAMLVASLRTLMNFHDERLTLRVNHGETAMLDTPLLFVGNNDYELEFPRAGCRSSLTDGTLSVFVMRKKGAAGLLAAALRALIGRTRRDDMVRLDDVRSLAVTSTRPALRVSLDGETRKLAPPLDYRIRPASLSVLVPAAGQSAAA